MGKSKKGRKGCDTVAWINAPFCSVIILILSYKIEKRRKKKEAQRREKKTTTTKIKQVGDFMLCDRALTATLQRVAADPIKQPQL